MKKLSTILITALVIMMLLMISTFVDAKGGSFGGRSSSSSFSRSSSSSSSRSITVSRNNSSSSSSSKSKSIKVTRDNVMNTIGKKGAQGVAAGVLYKDFQTRNSPLINNRSTINKADVDKIFTPQYRSNRKTEYYGQYRPVSSSHYNQYTNHSGGGYGIWDLMLFNSIMDNVGDRGMYYHHQNDPAFQQWRTDANAACAAGDTDVCDKLKDLDREMAEYRAKGVPVNSNYITPGVDPDIYEANNIDLSKLSEIKICVGTFGSDYSRYAATIAKITKLKVKPIMTNGSVDALTKLATGECDIGFVQDDIALSSNIVKLATMNQLEVGLLICNKEAKIKNVTDITNNNTIFVGSDQTGSQFTLNELRKFSVSLEKARIDNTRTTLQAAEIVQTQNNACYFAVSTPEFPGFMNLDNSNKAHGVPIFSFDLTKDHHYKLITTDVKHYKNLTQDQYKKYGWFTSGGTDTIAVPTSLVAPQSWIDQNKDLYGLLLLEKVNIQTSLQ